MKTNKLSTGLRFGAAALVAGAMAAAHPAARRAGVAGDWTMSYTTTEGVKLESTLTLTADADKPSCVANATATPPVSCGTISSARGLVALNEVSVTGDKIMFAIVRTQFGDNVRIEYTGTISGDTMKLKMKAGLREPVDVAVKRK